MNDHSLIPEVTDMTPAAARSLEGRVGLVAGATRGAGRAIAIELGAAGATVYASGRSTRGRPSPMGRPETIDETAELVEAAGGTAVVVAADHTDPSQVERLVERVRDEQGGRLDVLVNDIWGGDPLTDWDAPFWEHSLADGLRMQELAVWTHLITSRYAVPLMVERGRGLVIEVTDGADLRYRGNLYYDLAKTSVIRLARAQAAELRAHGVAAVALTPGFMRSEAVLDHFGVTEANWRDGIERDRHFAASETPRFVGRAAAALAADEGVIARSGEALTSWELAREYGFTDVDGASPDWGAHFREHVESAAAD
jgi:NAD(P)-dependent dehydrogenase (short-subunit alcohol dehydrogenase family)